MTTQEYEKKLEAFNSTEKYKKELEFLGKLVPMGDLLDYGAGIGTAAKYLRWYKSGKRTRTNKVKVIEPAGYYRGHKNDNLYNFVNANDFRFDCVYFMHSIAHIKNIEKALADIRNNWLVDDGEVVVITPNKAYLEMMDKPSYKPDPTVLKHYYIHELVAIFNSVNMYVTSCGKFGEEFHMEEPERLFLVAKKK